MRHFTLRILIRHVCYYVIYTYASCVLLRYASFYVMYTHTFCVLLRHVYFYVMCNITLCVLLHYVYFYAMRSSKEGLVRESQRQRHPLILLKKHTQEHPPSPKLCLLKRILFDMHKSTLQTPMLRCPTPLTDAQRPLSGNGLHQKRTYILLLRTYTPCRKYRLALHTCMTVHVLQRVMKVPLGITRMLDCTCAAQTSETEPLAAHWAHTSKNGPLCSTIKWEVRIIWVRCIAQPKS